MRSMAFRREVVAPRAPERTGLPSPPDWLPLISSGELFAGGHEVVITHDGERYRLRVTRQNRLILTK